MVELILDNKISIKQNSLPENVQNELWELLTFTNPLYRDSRRWAGRKVTRHLRCVWKDGQDLHITRGFISELLKILDGHGVDYRVVDRTRCPDSVPISFKGRLLPEQIKAAAAIGERGHGIVTGSIGCGKKIITLYTIAQRKTPALIICKTLRQLHQWKAMANRFFGLDSPAIGMIGSGLSLPGEVITLATSRSLPRMIERLKAQVGFVVVDLCNLVNIGTYFKCVNRFDCRYLLGLATRSVRNDGLTGLMTSYLGPVIYQFENTKRFQAMGGKRPLLISRYTEFHQIYDGDYEALMSSMITDDARNAMIIDDIRIEAEKANRGLVVVSDRKVHLEILLSWLQSVGIEAGILTARMTTGQRSKTIKRFRSGALPVVMLTYKGLGWIAGTKVRGLFLITPLREPKLISSIMELLLNQSDEMDTCARLFDYVDGPMILKESFRDRCKQYRLAGFEDGTSRLKPKQLSII